MTNGGLFGSRTGWLRRALRNGSFAWAPGNPRDGLLVGSDRLDSSPADPAASNRMFFDPYTGAFRAGGTTAANTSWDSASRGVYSTATGRNCTASGIYSTASGNTSTASGIYSTASGNVSTASGNASTAFGSFCTASQDSSIALGNTSTASGGFSTAFGSLCIASAGNSTAFGLYSAASRHGQASFAAGRFTSVGDAQASTFMLRKSTTDATATEVALDGATSYLTIPNSRTMSFEIKVAAHRTDVSGTAAAWPSIIGGITRDATGDCRLLGTITGAGTTTLADAGALAWSVAVTADTANNRLAITVTGEAAKTIRWVARVEMVEVG